jgi:hypothetical protein
MDNEKRREHRVIQTKGATVTLTEVTVGLNVADVLRFEITSSTGYRAVLPACICERTPCLKRRGCDTSTHCHYNFHLLHAEALAGEVAKTYGSALKGRSTVGKVNYVGSKRITNIPVRDWEATEWAKTMEKLVE